jgi:hypothetical protein
MTRRELGAGVYGPLAKMASHSPPWHELAAIANASPRREGAASVGRIKLSKAQRLAVGMPMRARLALTMPSLTRAGSAARIAWANSPTSSSANFAHVAEKSKRQVSRLAAPA